ncbi:MAG: oxygen-independent coproporphyrinogen III oxidase [Rhodobacteraceae bacterium HLUCCA08]|nr:MAG: oxygen-independent coproporphyrinogen III oxidase [Rhodobacteraceae bacterium HLUCCA08]
MTEAKFGLYLHWPFCAAKCPYCDFNSHVSASVDEERWQRAYLSEIDRVGAETSGRVLRSVYFGGGTPSLMSPALVDAVLRRVRATWPMANDIEITLEANPSSVEAARFAGYREAGVNRVSLGVQALNDDDLRRLGRLHDVDQALRAVSVAMQVFDRVSFDLIYARQHQSLSDWREELSRALELRPRHLSLYQLTIEDGTAFGARYSAGKLAGLPNEDLGADMFELTGAMCRDAGLPAYEISNHAHPGDEGRHNMLCWQGHDYAGIGPGAHGRLTLDGRRHATETELAPSSWLERVETLGSGENRREVLSVLDVFEERVMMGLRVTEGVPDHLLLDQINYNEINYLVEIGLIEHDAGRVRASDRGRPVLNAILRNLLADQPPESTRSRSSS